jgi:ribosomal protein L7Ae-like RNA K-turn-binding protein
MNTIHYVPTHVGPSRLEQALAEAPELSDESKTKVCIIEDMARLGKLMEYQPIDPETFDKLYDMSLGMLEACQHNMQIKWNTRQYHERVFGGL